MSKLKPLLKKLYHSWATRSLAIGAGATVIDVSIGTLLATLFDVPTRFAAMGGLAIGTTINFLAHRYFAFQEKDAKVVDPAVKWLIMTVCQTVAHGQLMVMLRDWWGVPFVPAKMMSDLVVFTGAQLLLVRYVVFPKRKDEGVAGVEPATQPSPSE